MKRKLQIFVSSTFEDLIEERQAAVAAILKAGHIPAGMELFTSGDKSQMKTIERWIDESDVFMLILGGRYGSIEPITGLSYTELEYDYATAHLKPVFAVVIEEFALEARVRSKGSSLLEKASPKELLEFRKKVLSRTSSFFSDAKDVKLCVHESLSDFAADPGLKGWVAADDIEDTKTLHQLIDNLRADNAALVAQIEQLSKQPIPLAQSKEIGEEDQEIISLLRAIEIRIPADVNSEKEEVTRSLFAIAYNNRDILTNGITNHTSASAAEKFYYFNVLPKLQAHGLADNEGIAGVQYRRSFLNRTGQQLFARYEKQVIKSKAKSKAAEADANANRHASPARKVAKKAVRRTGK